MKRAVIILIVSSALLSGCTTARKAEKFYFKHPDLLADLCSMKFPVQPEYIPGKPVIVHDTIPGDSVPCPQPTVDPKSGALVPGKVQCPPSFRDTIKIVDTVKVPDLAKQQSLQKQAQEERDGKIKAETERDLLKRENKIYLWSTSGLAVLSLALLILFLRK